MFPKLAKAKRTKVAEYLKVITRVQRPELVELVLDGSLRTLTPIPVGQVKNAAYLAYNAEKGKTYTDESGRGRNAENVRSQAETVRAYLKRIVAAFEVVTGESFPLRDLAVTPGTPGTVILWAVE